MGGMEMAFNLCEEDLKDDTILCEKLVNLSSIVYTRHFYANGNEKQDLISVGVLKALSLVRGGKWDPEKGKLITYLYTGIRNEMHNYIYRISREVLMDNEFIDMQGSLEIEAEDTSFLEIRYEVVQEVCESFKRFGDISPVVALSLNGKGFKVVGAEGAKVEVEFEEFNEEFYIELIDRVGGAVLWKNREYYL